MGLLEPLEPLEPLGTEAWLEVEVEVDGSGEVGSKGTLGRRVRFILELLPKTMCK